MQSLKPAAAIQRRETAKNIMNHGLDTFRSSHKAGPLGPGVSKMQRFIVPVVIVATLAILAAIVSGAPPAEAQGRPPATANIQIVNGHNPGEVIISWNAVPAATHYRIGYVNMVTDYPLAKSTEGGRTGNWLETFVYVDVEAQNFVTSGTVYTIRRLEQGVRHAFVVLTNGSAYGEPTWPTTSPRWKFLVVTDQGGACPTAPPTTAAPPVTTPSTPLTNAELARRVRPALAQIIVTDSDGDTSSGTGFVVRSDGLVVTNRHVVDDASTVTVRMNTSDGQRLELTGRVLGRGILADLAVIRLDSNRTFVTLPLGDSDAVAQGDEITAWGYPLSSFLGTDPTLTRGIISSTNRIFEDTDYLPDRCRRRTRQQRRPGCGPLWPCRWRQHRRTGADPGRRHSGPRAGDISRDSQQRGQQPAEYDGRRRTGAAPPTATCISTTATTWIFQRDGIWVSGSVTGTFPVHSIRY